MSLFFETIRVQDGHIFHLDFHQKRLDTTISRIFGQKSDINLMEHIKPPSDKKLYRCKVIYDTKVRKVDFYPYQPKTFKEITLVDATISYRYKSTDRSAFDHLKEGIQSDDILIVKEGLLTDTSIANIALYDGLSWYTPQKPLLEGTYRAFMLKEKGLKIKNLGKKELQSCVKFAIMNAMIGFCELKNISFNKHKI